MRGRKTLTTGRFVAATVAAILLFFIGNTLLQGYAQTQRKNEIRKDTDFGRPEPSRPIRPEIPSANRYQEDKVFLEYADSLYKVQRFDTIDRQIVKGNVKFRQGGMWMFCDSAYYYPGANSLDAFSNVRMEQGDTLFAYADKVFYNGNTRLALLKNGPTREKVTLINKDVTLTTDSLDYDLGIELGWYSRWGTIDDKVNTLTSLYGEYSPATKLAEFYHDVVLVNNKDGFTMLTDTLHYDTSTHIANIDSRTVIQSENDTIITNLATYFTDTGNADLLSRSLIIHRDSTGNITTLEGDSIIYDNATRISRVYMFNDPYKRSYPMVLTDTAQKTTLIGGFGIYNDSTKEALATEYPLLMEYSQGDTLFLRADTIKTFIVTERVWSGKRRIRTQSGLPESNGNIIVRNDSGYLWIDTLFFSVSLPYKDLPLQMLEKAAPRAEAMESVEEIEEPGEVLIFEETNEEPLTDDNSDSLTEDKLDSLPDEKSESLPESPNHTKLLNRKELLSGGAGLSGDVGGPIPDMPSAEEMMPAEEEKAEAIKLEPEGLPEDSITKEFHVALAYHRGRFFKQDMQGVADSLVFVERDSMLYMFRKPIVWSGERQVTGNRIDVHFNDSTADWAYLPESGLMAEHVDEDFYNQISGKELKAWFENQTLRKLDVSGNVETIFLPQEADSTYNRMVVAESSYLEIYMDSSKMEKLKMWPEVSGTVTPIFLVKKSQQFLPKFRWWSFLRPEREWYGDRIHWADNLGEVPDELEQYFLTPSDFGEPKSFPASRGSAAAPNRMMAPGNMASDFPANDALDSLTLPEIEQDSELMQKEDAEAIINAEEMEHEDLEHEEIEEDASDEDVSDEAIDASDEDASEEEVLIEETEIPENE